MFVYIISCTVLVSDAFASAVKIVPCSIHDSCGNDYSKEHCTCGLDYVTRLFICICFRFCIYILSDSVKRVHNFSRTDSSICDHKVKRLKNVLHNLQPGKMEST